jgi:hypothetical protein
LLLTLNNGRSEDLDIKVLEENRGNQTTYTTYRAEEGECDDEEFGREHVE